MNLRCHLGSVIILLAMTWPIWAADATVLFQDDFRQGINSQWSGEKLAISTTPIAQRHFLGPFGAESVQLNLADLPQHRFVKLSLNALIMRSWDGNDPGHGPDVMIIQSGDGRTLFATSFGYFGMQSFPGMYGIHSALPASGATERNSLGYTFNGEPMDGVFPIECIFPHTGRSLTLRFMVYCDGIITDESWGLGKVRITLDDVMVPGNSQMDQAWQELAADDPATAMKAMFALIGGEDRASLLLANKLQGKSLPFDPPLLDASAIRIRPRVPDLSNPGELADPSQRQLALAAHVLKIIGSDAARQTLSQLIPPPGDLTAFTVTVREKQSGKPLPHLPIRVSGSGDPNSYPLFTNDQGELKLSFPGGMAALTYSSPRRTFIPVRGSIDLRAAAQAAGGKASIELERGTPIGGTVIDQEGNPVANATVKFEIRGRPSPNLWDPYTLTDSEGKWTFDLAPSALDQVMIGAFHPKFAISSGNSIPLPPYPSVAELQEARAKIVLRSGVPIEGIVQDSEGKPIPRAWVDWGAERGAVAAGVPPQSTDEQGRFLYTALPGQVIFLTAKAVGYAPARQSLRVADGPARVQFNLQPSKGIIGRVVSSTGGGIYGARIYLGTWQGVEMFDRYLLTDREGKFQWTDAPNEPVSGSLLVSGLTSRGITLTAGAQNLITITAPMLLRVKAVDAETGQPLAKFRLSFALVRAEGPPAWRQLGEQGTQGPVEVPIPADYQGVIVRIEGDGYLSTDSELIPVDAATRELEMKVYSSR